MTTPSYYPPGWDKERLLSASFEETETIPDEQYEAFRTGLRADLGEDGAREFFNERKRRNAEKRAAQAKRVAIKGAIQTLQHLSEQQNAEVLDWGFVVFLTTGYDDDSSVREIKESIQALINQQFDDAIGGPLDSNNVVQHTRDTFRLMWVEGKDLSGATPQEVARRYRDLVSTQTLGIGMEHSLCLCVDASSVKSILLQQQSGGRGLAHVLAVSIDCGLETDGAEAEEPEWTGSFKVAVSSLIPELFTDIGEGSLDPFEIGAGVTDDLVWITSLSRDGKQKASC